MVRVGRDGAGQLFARLISYGRRLRRQRARSSGECGAPARQGSGGAGDGGPISRALLRGTLVTAASVAGWRASRVSLPSAWCQVLPIGLRRTSGWVVAETIALCSCRPCAVFGLSCCWVLRLLSCECRGRALLSLHRPAALWLLSCGYTLVLLLACPTTQEGMEGKASTFLIGLVIGNGYGCVKGEWLQRRFGRG